MPAGARYVHVGSATAKEPTCSIDHVVANATRPSTVGLLKTVADECARYGITVNTVAPGWIETKNSIDYLANSVGATTDDQRRQFLMSRTRIPAGRMSKGSEIASLIVYLCSDDAVYITGNWIEVDSGLPRSAF